MEIPWIHKHIIWLFIVNMFPEEKESVQKMKQLNHVLIDNILPAHIARHYLDNGQSQGQVSLTSLNTRLPYCSSLHIDIGEAYQKNFLMQ